MSARTRVVAVALDPEDADQLIEAIGGPGQPFFALVARQIPATGTLLGYEVVGAEATLDFHSWHCHGYADDLQHAKGITVNALGLFSTLADAHIGLTWMTELPIDEAPAPVPWCTVALFEVTSTEAS